jgi:hypothetical protein
MSLLNYVVPLLVFGALALYYLNIYRKGKAAGGGFMAVVQAHHQERWQEVLQPGEALRIWGTGLLWRPWWQYELARQIPLFKLVWPVKMFEMVITDRERILVGSYSAIGTLSEKRAYPKRDVRLEELFEEKPGLAMKLNPLVPKDYKTFQGTIVTSDRRLKLLGIPGNFIDNLHESRARVGAP